MMNSVLDKNWKKLQVFLVFVLIVAALFPPFTVARAQDGVPPAGEETTSEVESVVDDTTAETGAPAEEQPIQTAEDDGLAEEPALEETEALAIPEPPEVTQEGESETTEESEPPAESLSEVVEAMVESDAVLVDASGEEIPLATETASEILSNATDPWFTANDGSGKIVGYTTIGGSCHSSVTECNPVANPVGAAVGDARSTGQVVQVLAGYYDEEVTITKVITLQGVANGALADAVVRKINLNVDISGWNHVLGEEVLVNSGAHIQDGIDIVQAGGTVNVAPGEYEEEAKDRTVNGGTAKYQFGLYVGKDKNGITVHGVKADGTPVSNYGEAAALVKTNATNNFGYSGILVEGDNVTFDGLKVGDNKPSNNKTFEILGNAFTLQNSQIIASDGGSVYINDWNYDPATATSSITDYKILGNYFAYGGSVDVSSGAGATGPAANRVIANNVFSGLQKDGSNATWSLTSFNGNNPSVGWFVYPVGGATITGNTYSNSSMYIRSRGTVVDSTFDWKSYWDDNTFDHGAVTLDNLGTFDIHEYSYTSGSYSFSNVRRIGSSIQAEIDISSDGNTVLAGPGEFVENLVINKTLEVAGAGAGNTVIIPAVSHPTCASASSICSGSSNIILVQADGVKIHDMTLNGDNPNLTSGQVSRGADIDARNGIITNHAAGVFNNLEVYNTEVLNIFLRGIYASSDGTFNIHDNYVENVNGDSQSIAMMNYGGSGIFQGNLVKNSHDGIVSQYSTGTQFLNNRIENSGTGIHSDNYRPSASAPFGPELIQGNTVLDNPNNGYGIFVFAPGGPVLVDGNRIENVAVGLAASGSTSRAPGVFGATTTFSNNFVDNKNLAGSIGALITTDLWGWGYAPVSAYLYNNFISNNEYGVVVEDQAQTWNSQKYDGPYLVHLNATYNGIVNNTVDVWNHTTSVVQMPNNWWNDNNGPQNLDLASMVTIDDWLELGLDANPTTVNKRESSAMGTKMYSSGDPAKAQVPVNLWWFDPTEVVSFEQTSLGSLVDNVFTAGTTAGTAWFGSTYFGKNFFDLALVHVVDPRDDGDGNGGALPPVIFAAGGAGGPLGGLIPVTGGMNQLSCTEANTLVLASGTSVSFSAPLCGFEAGLTEEAGDALPVALPSGLTFAAGITFNLEKGGTDFPGLPDPVTSTVSFSVPDELAGKTLVILFWDASANGGLGGWVEVPGSAAGTATVNYTGTFVLAYK